MREVKEIDTLIQAIHHIEDSIYQDYGENSLQEVHYFVESFVDFLARTKKVETAIDMKHINQIMMHLEVGMTTKDLVYMNDILIYELLPILESLVAI